jgi:hypothetical protein
MKLEQGLFVPAGEVRRLNDNRGGDHDQRTVYTCMKML